VLNEEGPEERVGKVEGQVGSDQALHGAGEAPAIGEFAKKGLSGENSKSSGYGGDVAKVAGNEVFERGLKIHPGENQLIQGKNREADKGEGGAWPDEAPSALPDADSSNQGDHNDSDTVNSSKKGHG
jgi:hypothetical protein